MADAQLWWQQQRVRKRQRGGVGRNAASAASVWRWGGAAVAAVAAMRQWGGTECASHIIFQGHGGSAARRRQGKGGMK